MSLLIALLLSTTPATPAAEASCAAATFGHLVSPLGAPRAWQSSPEMPEALRQRLGELIADAGQVADGYEHRMLVDDDGYRVWVVQRGGFGGSERLFGPFPRPACLPEAIGTRARAASATP
ncbi:MAG: hypothetical protein Q4F49_01595 [Pseudoxanthomonas suwonensis]|nr:hypothetical protein [Pseudoxanthomonas suwonensis]